MSAGEMRLQQRSTVTPFDARSLDGFVAACHRASAGEVEWNEALEALRRALRASAVVLESDFESASNSRSSPRFRFQAGQLEQDVAAIKRVCSASDDSLLCVAASRQLAFRAGPAALSLVIEWERQDDASIGWCDDALKLAAFHIGCAFGRNQEGPRIAHASSLAEALLERLSIPVLVMDAQRVVRHMNRAATEVLRHHRQLRVEHGVLQCQRARDSSEIDRVLCAVGIRPGHTQRSTAESMQGLIKLAADSSSQVAHLLIFPAMTRTSLGLLGEEALAVVFVFSRHRVVAEDPQMFAELFGLTSAEARLLTGLIAGMPLKRIASTFQLSEHTVRCQLKSLMKKMHIRQQPDLVSFLNTLPPIR